MLNYISNASSHIYTTTPCAVAVIKGKDLDKLINRSEKLQALIKEAKKIRAEVIAGGHQTT